MWFLASVILGAVCIALVINVAKLEARLDDLANENLQLKFEKERINGR